MLFQENNQQQDGALESDAKWSYCDFQLVNYVPITAYSEVFDYSYSTVITLFFYLLKNNTL